jgi:2-oxoisovalerate dehydrogenase E1 component
LKATAPRTRRPTRARTRSCREWARDPLPKLRSHSGLSDKQWKDIEREVAAEVAAAVAEAQARGISDPERVTDTSFSKGELQQVGGLLNSGFTPPRSSEEPKPEGQRINMVTAIRRTLDQELQSNPRVLLFGEDIGPKGGVHAVTLGLQEKFGRERVFDTSLNEEGSSAALLEWRSPG